MIMTVGWKRNLDGKSNECSHTAVRNGWGVVDFDTFLFMDHLYKDNLVKNCNYRNWLKDNHLNIGNLNDIQFF